MSPLDFMIIAHQGASSYAPENTLAAFYLAQHMGIQHIELDVHFSSDGHIIVIHDEDGGPDDQWFRTRGEQNLGRAASARRRLLV
jgi:glycerophosphoryl diester phosphodiesterase